MVHNHKEIITCFSAECPPSVDCTETHIQGVNYRSAASLWLEQTSLSSLPKVSIKAIKVTSKKWSSVVVFNPPAQGDCGLAPLLAGCQGVLLVQFAGAASVC
jgi:hypothetical protein